MKLRRRVGRAAVASNELTARWASLPGDDDVVISGAGCWLLLALLASGASGPARSELEAAVDMSGTESQVAALGLFDDVRKSAAVKVALGIWSRVVLDPDWRDALPPGVAGHLTGDTNTDQGAVDRWAREATSGEIDRFPITLGRDMALVLASAITMRTDWQSAFAAGEATLADGPWAGHHITRLSESTNATSRLRLGGENGRAVTILTVPGRDHIDVCLLLGTEGASRADVLAAGIHSLPSAPAVSAGTADSAPGVACRKVIGTQRNDRLECEVPAFELSASHDLLDHADLFGLSAAQDPTVDHFPGLAAEPLAVSQARQEALARFSATGFVASAVSAVAMRPTGAPPRRPPKSFEVTVYSVRFTRPFGFVAVHRPTSLVLMAGWIAQPPRAPSQDKSE